MIYPSIDDLMEKVDSKYTLVIAAAKRARMLNEGAPKLIETNSSKDVTVALEEIAAGKISYERVMKQED
ncbi:MAG: DNA-directed RNA polymerase subunit omega [Firmicutes bacterium]|nr:DNA-directed RNA polymerase subunit omega [Bacillota bacterium]